MVLVVTTRIVRIVFIPRYYPPEYDETGLYPLYDPTYIHFCSVMHLTFILTFN